MKKKELQGVKEIARRANVAIATVDRVIHNRGGVSEKTRAKISRIIEEMNYQPNLLARRLASGKNTRLAALIPSATEALDFWEAPLRGIRRAEAELRAYGISVELYFFDLHDKSSFTKQTSQLLASEPDGIVLAPMFVDEAREVAALCQAKAIPYVFIDSAIPGLACLSYIGPPLLESGLLAGKLSTYALKGQGTVLVVNMAADLDSFTYRQIEKGFRSFFESDRPGVTIHRIDIPETDQSAVNDVLAGYFSQYAPIDVIFVTNSRTFLAARYLEQQTQYPKPMLIGYDLVADNLMHLQKGTIDFLICHQPEDQGYRSMMTLYQYLIFDSPAEPVQYMPIDIITRENYAFYKN